MKHEIHYEFGKAVLYSPVPPEEALNRFHKLAGQCFGIRKSIGDTNLLSSMPFDGLPEPWCRFQGGHEMLVHSGGDEIIWDAKGNKIKSEWD